MLTVVAVVTVMKGSLCRLGYEQVVWCEVRHEEYGQFARAEGAEDGDPRRKVGLRLNFPVLQSASKLT